LDVALADTEVDFAPCTPVIAETAFSLLDALAVSALECADQGLTLEIEGHTDGSGGEATNLLLSNGRAKAIETYLTDAGVPTDALRAVGYGAHYPIADAATDEGSAQNQRIVFDWE
jgi:OOP family OmpA-OmpF porin